MDHSRFFFSARAAACALLLSLLVVGCGSSRAPSGEPVPDTTRAATDVEAQLRSAAEKWRGVSHERGGSTRHGVDCSGLVQSVYQAHFGHSLPRTTDKQVQTGRKVQRSALRPGDLVFFRHARKKYHVGIYLSGGEFLHASSSEGVTVSPLDRPYWTERWWQARRLLSVSTDSSRAPSRSPPTKASSKVGW